MTLSVFQDRSESKSETCVAYFLVEFSIDYEEVLYVCYLFGLKETLALFLFCLVSTRESIVAVLRTSSKLTSFLRVDVGEHLFFLRESQQGNLQLSALFSDLDLGCRSQQARKEKLDGPVFPLSFRRTMVTCDTVMLTSSHWK